MLSRSLIWFRYLVTDHQDKIIPRDVGHTCRYWPWRLTTCVRVTSRPAPSFVRLQPRGDKFLLLVCCSRSSPTVSFFFGYRAPPCYYELLDFYGPIGPHLPTLTIKMATSPIGTPLNPQIQQWIHRVIQPVCFIFLLELLKLLHY